MSVLNFLAKLPRFLLRLYEWAAGRRLYSWTSSPPHRIFAMIAHRAYGPPYLHYSYRVLYALAGGVLKYRERIHADRMNFGARLNGPVTADVLRNAALWQRSVLDAPPYAPKVHANLRVVGDVEEVQLDRLMSFLLMSDIFANVNVFFDEQGAQDARVVALTVAEERRGWREVEWDLNAPGAVRPESFDDAGWAQIFSTRTGFDRNVNNYLKTAHPGAYVVALSLPESEDGFCDKWLGPWAEAAFTLALGFPDVTFVVLNRVGPAAFQSPAGAARSAITFARKAGLSLAEAAIFAQKADAFVGQTDIFGLAARAARRPGVYMSPERTDLSDPEAGVIHTGLLTPNEAMAQFRIILANRQRPAAAASGALSDSESGKRLRRRAPDASYSMDLPGTPHTLAVPTRPPASTSSSVLSSDTGKQVTPRTVGAPRLNDLLATQYTLVVPTYNRHAMLSRLLAYLERVGAPFCILVLDSSEAGAQQENARAISGRSTLNIRHVTFPTIIDPYVKMREGLEMVTTPYCSICADDDLVIVPAIRRCAEELGRDPTVAVAHGYYFNFNESSTFDLSFVVYRGKSLDGKTSLARLRTLFAAYEAVLYGIYRTAIAQRVFREVDKMNTVLGRELLTAALTVIAGKTLRVPDFYYGRSTGESFSYRAWHPHQILAQDPAALFARYPAFRELLLEALAEYSPGLNLQSAGMVIDLVMLKYLDPFLRSDVLDLIINARLRGAGSDAIVDKIWRLFVKTPRWDNLNVPLIEPSTGRFTPNRMGAGRLRDYVYEATASNGNKRVYRVFYEFLFPDKRPPAVVNQEQLVVLLGSLDAY